MKKLCFVVFGISLLLSGCGDAVPEVDAHKPVVNGESMTQAVYLNKYCTDKQADKMCEAVRHAMREDATKGQVPKGW